MPKGDRLRLKADPEDGTTPIANLLLEAVAMAKLSGLQKGAILYLWRRTYGWVEDGKRLKERKIALTEWKTALDSEKSRVSKTLTELETRGIIKRRMADAWGGYYYSINTNIRNWDSNCINIARLSEMVTVVNFSTVVENATVDQTNNSSLNENATVVENATQQLSKTQLPTLYKEILKKDIKKEGVAFSASPNNPHEILKTIETKPNETVKIIEVDDNSIKIGIVKTKTGDLVKEVFVRLDKLRGYRPPKRKAEAAAIIRMLKAYSPDDIISTWEKLKNSDKFWQGKELFMMTVESQIGAILQSKVKPVKASKYGDGW